MTLVRGKPLIQYTIDTALECASLDQIVVLSDDPEVDHLVENRYPNNARIVFMREPACIAQDYSTDYQACLYTLITLERMISLRPKFIVHLRCSHLLRNPAIIDRAVQEFMKGYDSKFYTLRSYYDSLRSVSVAQQSPYKMWIPTGDPMEIKPLLTHPYVKEPYNHQRQRLPMVYHQNGYVDITRYSTVMEKQSMSGDHVMPFIVELEPGEGEIDTPEELKMAIAHADYENSRGRVPS